MVSSQSEKRAVRVVELYGNILYRLCVVTLGNEADSQDAVQETFIRYINKAPSFESEEHEKAWLITVAGNICRDMLRFRLRHPVVDTSFIKDTVSDSEKSYILEALVRLPEKYKTVMYLYYVEEYKVEEIAGIIKKSNSAVKMRLSKGRELLKEIYEREYM